MFLYSSCSIVGVLVQLNEVNSLLVRLCDTVWPCSVAGWHILASGVCLP